MPMADAPIGALILFGPPGSGKGTQARLIRDRLSIPHIATGDMLRERMRQEDEFGRSIARLVEQGALVGDDLVNRMVEERIGRPDCRRGFILDGYPRTLGQARALQRLLGSDGRNWLVIHLVVDYNEIVKRLAGRRHCPQCGAVYHLISRPPEVPEVCDACHAALIVRHDDREEVVRARLEAYERQTRPLLEFFAASGGPVYEVDAAGSPPAIAQRIFQWLRPDPLSPESGTGKSRADAEK